MVGTEMESVTVSVVGYELSKPGLVTYSVTSLVYWRLLVVLSLLSKAAGLVGELDPV